MPSPGFEITYTGIYLERYLLNHYWLDTVSGSNSLYWQVLVRPTYYYSTACTYRYRHTQLHR